MALLWPSRRFVSRVNPQGQVAARLGSTCLNEATNILYQKLGGGNTQFGWYPVPTFLNGNFSHWSVRSGTALTFASAGDASNGALGSFNSGGSVPEWNITDGARPMIPSIGIPIFSAITSLTAGGYNWWRWAATASAQMAAANTLLTGAVPAYLIDVDVTVRIVTTPPINVANPQPDNTIAGIRIWGLVLQQNANLSGSNEVNSDVLDTARPNSQGESLAIRYSTSAVDPGWVGVICTSAGVQATTGALAAAPVFVQNGQPWRLRIRRVMTDGGPPGTAYFSVNDGAELTLPIAAEVQANNRNPLMIGGSVWNLDGARKTLGVVDSSLYWGVG